MYKKKVLEIIGQADRLVDLCIGIIFLPETPTFKPSKKPMKSPSNIPTQSPSSTATGDSNFLILLCINNFVKTTKIAKVEVLKLPFILKCLFS